MLNCMVLYQKSVLQIFFVWQWFSENVLRNSLHKTSMYKVTEYGWKVSKYEGWHFLQDMKNVTSAVYLISWVCHVTDWWLQKCNSSGAQSGSAN